MCFLKYTLNKNSISSLCNNVIKFKQYTTVKPDNKTTYIKDYFIDMFLETVFYF